MARIAEQFMEAVRAAQKSISVREREILALVAQGFTNIEIGEHLSITRTTVRTHLENIYHKLCVHDRTEAVVKYFFSAESQKVIDAAGLP
jgi:ATP/maltotriose-dependent transcriptional regulator MalT